MEENSQSGHSESKTDPLSITAPRAWCLTGQECAVTLAALLKREQLSFTPPTLALRKAREDLLDRLGSFRSEDGVRQAVTELNGKIREINAKPTSGPPSTLMPLNVDRIVEMWQERRADAS